MFVYTSLILWHLLLYFNPLNAEIHIKKLIGPFDIGEEPTWDHRKQILYFCDIFTGQIYGYNYKTKELNTAHVGEEVTPILPTTRDGIFIVGLGRTLTAIKWDGRNGTNVSQVTLSTVSNDYPTSAFNDGKPDKRGRIWIGTRGAIDENANLINIEEGRLFEFTKNNLKNPDILESKINISNGMAWNKANTKFYFATTFTNHVEEYDYNESTGNITFNECVLCAFNRTLLDVSLYPDISGVPDGMTIDTNDNLWVALFSGGAIAKVCTVSGKILKVINLPAIGVTSLMFGGPNLDILYVTTSRILFGEQSNPDAGFIFEITGTGSKGLPQNFADVYNGPV